MDMAMGMTDHSSAESVGLGGASGEEDNDTEKEGPALLKVNAKERSG